MTTKVSNDYVFRLLNAVLIDKYETDANKEVFQLAINLIQVQENRIIEQDKFREDVGFNLRGEDNYPLRMENKKLREAFLNHLETMSAINRHIGYKFTQPLINAHQEIKKIMGY